MGESTITTVQFGGKGPAFALNAEGIAGLIRVADSSIGLARTAKCRLNEGADSAFALIHKDKLNRLKHELRKLAPGCLGKE